MLNAPLRIMIVAALCVLGLIGIVLREGYERSRPPTATSHDIELRMQAIDPRALLSGHYVIVSLQGRYIHPAGAEPCADFTAVADNESWIAITKTSPDPRVPDPTLPRDLSPVGTAATREAAQAIADAVRPGGLAVRGTAYCSELPDETTGPGAVSVSTVQLTLPGVARFYAPQAEAERIDALLRQANGDDTYINAIVNIGGDGRARLKGLNVNGEIIELNWL